MRVVVITPPDPIISLREAADHLRLGDDLEEFGYVEQLIASATEHVDGPSGWLGRALGLQTLEVRVCGFSDIIRLPYEPIIDIVSVHYLDSAGQPQLVDPDTYELFGRDLGCAWGKSWPTPGVYRGQAETVRIRYRAGYAVDADADPVVQKVPAPIRSAILLMVGDLFSFRQTAAFGSGGGAIEMSTTVENLLSPYRVYN
ncbi:hypothetical protein GS397_14985 [Sphingobium yanoikuyae]|uniref:Phage gp6-like head-tail connector protein n=1 Tax=Sphingobium yanoikuyae TaxID=13690 RepID=A0A6P1GID9_SPHYA|nr:hypothetical protein [Sphingobium yanoikuyae]QHD68219.1 hypothetical protein GS397_14985 [Sphingobium yanoikuyae]